MLCMQDRGEKKRKSGTDDEYMADESDPNIDDDLDAADGDEGGDEGGEKAYNKLHPRKRTKETSKHALDGLAASNLQSAKLLAAAEAQSTDKVVGALDRLTAVIEKAFK